MHLSIGTAVATSGISTAEKKAQAVGLYRGTAITTQRNATTGTAKSQ